MPRRFSYDRSMVILASLCDLAMLSSTGLSCAFPQSSSRELMTSPPITQQLPQYLSIMRVCNWRSFSLALSFLPQSCSNLAVMNSTISQPWLILLLLLSLPISAAHFLAYSYFLLLKSTSNFLALMRQDPCRSQASLSASSYLSSSMQLLIRFSTQTSVRGLEGECVCWVCSIIDLETFREFSCSLMILNRQDCDFKQLLDTALQSSSTRREEVSMVEMRSVYFAKQTQGRYPYSRSYSPGPQESATLKVFMMLIKTSPSALVASSGLTQNPQSYLASILSCLYLKLTVKKKAVRSLSLPSFLILLNCARALLSEVKPFMKTEKQKQHSSPFIFFISYFSYLFSQAIMQIGLCFFVRRLSWQFFLMPLKTLARGKIKWPMSLGSSEQSRIWLRFSMMKREEKT